MSQRASLISTAPQSAKRRLRQHCIAVRKQIPLWRREWACLALAKELFSRLKALEGPILSFVTMGSEIDTTQFNRSLGMRLIVPHVEGGQIVVDRRPSLILVPGLAFDSRFHRLGYGMGCYDRLLAQLPDVPTCGIGFAEQHCSSPLPMEPHDVALDEVVLL